MATPLPNEVALALSRSERYRRTACFDDASTRLKNRARLKKELTESDCAVSSLSTLRIALTSLVSKKKSASRTGTGNLTLSGTVVNT